MLCLPYYLPPPFAPHLFRHACVYIIESTYFSIEEGGREGVFDASCATSKCCSSATSVRRRRSEYRNIAIRCVCTEERKERNETKGGVGLRDMRTTKVRQTKTKRGAHTCTHTCSVRNILFTKCCDFEYCNLLNKNLDFYRVSTHTHHPACSDIRRDNIFFHSKFVPTTIRKLSTAFLLFMLCV